MSIDLASLRSHLASLPEANQQAVLSMIETLTAPPPVPVPQTPSPFKGEHDADTCQNFIDNQEEYFHVVKLSESQWVQYTALNLTDEAKSWWRSCGLTINSPWGEFKKAFLAFFTPPNAVAAARESLENLRQGKRTVAAFTHDFRRLRCR
ncbi:hypothetical protein BGZ65_000340, partial [Modicella reniformis]